MNAAQLSDRLIWSSIGVLALSFVAFALVIARLGSRARAAASSKATAVPVSARTVSARTVSTLTAPAGASGQDHELHVSSRLGGRLGGRLPRSAFSLFALATTLLAAAVLARGVAAGRAPWGNMFEYAVVTALAAAVALTILARRHPDPALGLWISGATLLTLGLSMTVLYSPVDDLVPALNSRWLVVHVAAAITAAGAFTVGAAAAVLLMLRSRADRKNATTGRTSRLPTVATLDGIVHATTLFAFPVWTFAVLAGAVWAENAWGRYWGWDPKETWAFITWVLYAGYLHAGTTAGWRGRKANRLALAGYAAFLFNFVGVNIWVNGLHSYAGV